MRELGGEEAVNTPVEIKPGRYACPLCEDRFEGLGDKRRHLRTEHPGEGGSK